MAQARPAHPIQQRQRPFDQSQRALLNAKAKPLLEPRGAEDARRVIHETQAVQHPDAAVPQVALAAPEVQQLAERLRRQADRQRIDREIPPVQVELDRALLHRRQRGGILVELRPRRHEVQRVRPVLPPAKRAGDLRIEDPGGGAELRVLAHRPAVTLHQRAHQGDGVALHHQVDVSIRAGQQQVTHKAAHAVQAQAHRLRLLADRPNQTQQAGRQGAFQPAHDLAPPGDAVVRLSPALDQVGTGHDPDQAAVAVHHRHLPPAGVHHLLLQITD